MFSFSPFDKDLSDLDAADLAVLKTVAEGWYIEYKQEIPKADSIAKSVAAMANSYGGWVFYGVKEESKTNSVAGEFIGIAVEEAESALSKIRQAVAGAINPACHYEAKAILGPCYEIGLKESMCIICVVVPQSLEAPHVHSKGVIYRRIADGSEPVPETDRQMIDKMFQRSKQTIESFETWVEKDPELSEGESETPYLRLMIAPNLWNLPRKKISLDIGVIKSALNKIEGRDSSIPFDTIYSSSSGIIARQCKGGDPTGARLTWQFYHDFSSEVLIPLSWIKGDATHLRDEVHRYDFGNDFVNVLEESGVKTAKVVSLSILYHLIMGLVSAQREIFAQAGWSCSFYIKTKLLNVWRTVPFIDCKFYIDYLREHGIPVSLIDDITSPVGSHPDTFFCVNDNEEVTAESARVMLQTIWCFIPIAEGFGIPIRYLMLEDSEQGRDIFDKDSIIKQITDAGLRAAAL
ncbi:ATP-binding protein [Pseudomonas syringae]|uniref:AlbA family DNA-binding domain-containing protein n=1 Tax=Pseudomonas syringae TaxID=317 RepID=UPI001BCC14E4|nr:ATP-binding protein [Pseudomonas syringae]MBS7472168.1 ATP-binding protein [Pseudomonas syringae]